MARVHVETVDLSSRGVSFPADRVGMVIAQPYVPDESLTPTEPYQCTEQAKAQRLTVLSKTLEAARQARHGEDKTHFTIFPEYSIPGLDGIAFVEQLLNATEWPVGTVVIGGIDALNHTQYSELLRSEMTHVSAWNGADQVTADQWVNCAITWIKGDDGKLERWIQPKVHPAWEEMNISHQQMFQGRSIYLFKGLLNNRVPYRFGTVICFDWIATVGAKKTYQWLLAEVDREAGQYQLPLSWLFIIQRNPQPSHRTFLSQVDSFFNQTEYSNALRSGTSLVFCNTAGKATPGHAANFGGSSLVSSHQSGFIKPNCAPTFSGGGPRFRDGSDLLANYKDTFFRERGACIHSFAQINPSSLIAGPAGRSFAIENAHVFPLTDTPEPRAPRAAVPASVKWLHDELDELPSLSKQHPTAQLNQQADESHTRSVDALRTLPSQTVTRAVELATEESKKQNPDEWNRTQADALKHVVHTLDIVGIGFTLATGGANTAHAAVSINNTTIDLLAIRGNSHESCIKHSKQFLPHPRRQMLLVSRDSENMHWRRRFGSFLETESRVLDREHKITEPEGGFLHLGYRNLLDVFLQSTSPSGIGEAINTELVAKSL